MPNVEGCAKSRYEIFEDEGHVIDMPDCELTHIIEYVSEIGLSIGENPLTYGEIESWKNIAGIEIQPWEGQFIKRISSFYLSEYRRSTDKDAESIWGEVPKEMTSKYRSAMRQKMAMRKLAED